MRLIDADALEVKIGDKLIAANTPYRLITHDGILYGGVLNDITDAPTINAIPVEWLRNVHKNWILTRDDMEFRDWLIQTWQKEQEAR